MINATEDHRERVLARINREIEFVQRWMNEARHEGSYVLAADLETIRVRLLAERGQWTS